MLLLWEAMLPTVTLLGIDLTQATPGARAALTLSEPELDELLRAACASEGTADVVIVADERRFEIYATDVSRPDVLRAILPTLFSRAGGRTELGEPSVIEAEGPSAARHLMRVACGIGAAPDHTVLADLRTAMDRSRRAGALGPELSALFAAAMETGFRAQAETLAGDGPSSQAEPELVGLEVDRIVEEELVAWRRASLTSLATLGAPPEQDRSAHEPMTFVRRNAPSLRGMRLA